MDKRTEARQGRLRSGGYGTHDPRPNRQRTRAAEEAAAIDDYREDDDDRTAGASD